MTTPPRVLPRRSLLLDLVLALLAFGLELWSFTVEGSAPIEDIYGVEVPGPNAVNIAALAALALPVAWRRVAPLTALGAVVVIGFAAVALLGLPLSFVAALPILLEVAARRERRISLAALAAVTVTAMLGFVLAFRESDPWTLAVLALTYPPWFAIPWTIGWRRRAKLQREQLLDAQERERSLRAVADERARVARELHDILAHSISVMVEEAVAGRRVLRSVPHQASQALARIETTGRESMVEVRRLLALLRGEVVAPQLAPQPGLDSLGELLGQVRAAGVSVTVTVEGARRPLDPSVDLSAYRIVEEAFANVRKHAPGAEVALRLAYREEALRVEVADTGGGQPWRPVPAEQGTGLLGMHERALLIGGSLRAGATPGGFAVVAELPLAAVSATAGGVER